MHLLHNIDACSRNNRCCGKAINITYSECVFVSLIIKHARFMRRIIVIRGLSDCTIFFFTLSQITLFFKKKKKKVIKYKMCVLIFSVTFI